MRFCWRRFFDDSQAGVSGGCERLPGGPYRGSELRLEPIGSVRLLRKSVECIADQNPDLRKKIFAAWIDATLRRRCGSRDVVATKVSDEELLT